MANTLRIKRRAAGGASGAPASLANAELAFNEQDDTLYYGKGTAGAGGTATSVEAIAGKGAFVNLTGTQAVSGDKTFSGVVVVPTPSSSTHAATKGYVDTEVATRIAASEKGANNGVATLDSAGKVPSSQLPAYVDDVLEYANLAAFPATGSSGVIYVAIDTGVVYRWSGSAYVVISSAGTADTATKLTTARSITATGDASWTVSFDGSADVSAALTLASSGVAAGTYNDSATAVRPFTVDAKGRVTSIGTAVTIAPAFSSVTGKPTTLSGYGITDGLSTDSTIDGGTF